MSKTDVARSPAGAPMQRIGGTADQASLGHASRPTGQTEATERSVPTRSRGSRRDQPLLSHRHMPRYVALLAVALWLPALWSGLYGDDYYLRWVLTDSALAPEWSRTAFDLFAFVPSDQELTRRAVAHGALPWWTHERLRLAFFRPLTGLTHWFDFRLWPSQLWLMHLHSLIWFGAAVAAAAVAFRRLVRPPALAGLAALLYAVDEAHLGPAVWLCARNGAISTFFALVTLIAHDRWRRDGWRPGRAVAPIALSLGLLAGEMALAAGCYLIAYAVFIDRDRWQRRLASLVPAGLVGAVFCLAYLGFGYGVRNSGMYLDPIGSPLEYARALVERAPLFLFGQWIGSAEAYFAMTQGAAHVFWLWACGAVVVITGLLLPLLIKHRTARFFALGMVLSLLPVCGAVAQDRLLMLIGFGGMGLLAQFMAAVWKRARWMPRTRLWWWPVRFIRGVLVVIHLVLAPISVVATGAIMHTLDDPFERAAASLPSGPEVGDQEVLIVNTPSAFLSLQGLLMQRANGRAIPARTLILGSGIYPIEVERRGEQVLILRPEGGFLATPGSPRPGHQLEQPAVDENYAFLALDRLFRGGSPLRLGERIELTGVTVEITGVTPDGQPAEATFRFATRLDDPQRRWLEWQGGVYVPFALPAVGEMVTLPAARIKRQ